MPNPSAKSNRFVSRSRTFSRATAVFVALIGIAVLTGWLLDIPGLKGFSGSIMMKPNTAVGLILSGISLWLLQTNDKTRERIVGQVCAASVLLIGLLTLSEHVVGWNLGIDQLLFTEAPGALATVSPGRMGITASSSFTMFGVALLMLYHHRAISFAQVLSMIATFWALLALIGYTYHAEELFGIARYTGIAFQTSVALFVLGLGILATCADQGVLWIVCDDTAAGMMFRRLVVIGLGVPFILGWLRLAGQRKAYFDLGFGTALLVSAIIVIFLFAIWRAAVKLKKVELQRLATEALALEGEQRLVRQTALIDLSYEPIFLWDLDKGIIEWNKGSEQLYGYSGAEAIGRKSHELLKTEFPISVDVYQKEIELKNRWSGELRQKTRDGSEVLVESRQQLIESYPHRYVLETNRDITARRNAEEERERLLSQEHTLRVAAERANRVKDEFLATVSHELRTPLNAILGWATMLRKNSLDEATTSRGMEAIVRNAKSQAELIEDLLDVSRIVSGHMRLDVRPIALTSAIKAAMEAVQPAADAKNIQMQIIVDPSADNTTGDAVRLQQVIWNLLSNSIKFTPQDGRVEVRVERADTTAQIRVIDTGQGISADFLPYVFDRFKQADASITRKHSGLGLGLAIARHLVEMHGGTIEANSAGDGLGAIFTVRLPLLPARVTPVPAIDSAKTLVTDIATDSPNLRGIRILVVDDEADAREMLRVALEQLGANVTTASSARDALDVLPLRQPDVLVSDIGMPEVDGHSLIKMIRSFPTEKGGNTPAIALTGYVRVEERMQALESGYQMFVSKPVHIGDLAAMIDSLLSNR